MCSLKLGFLFLAAAVLASAFGGCASAPHCHELVVYVSLYDPEPYPPPPPVFPAPSVTVASPTTPRYTPIDRQQDASATMTRTRERLSSPPRVKPRAEPVRDERWSVRTATSDRDDELIVTTGRARTR